MNVKRRLLIAVFAAPLAVGSCTDADTDETVAVTWTFLERGTCLDIEADTFRLEVAPGGETFEVPCSDEELSLVFQQGEKIEMSAELVSSGEPVTVRLESGEFEVPPGGADVEFHYELEDFFYETDFRFVIGYTGANTCLDAAVTAQRITLRHGDGTLVEGAQVCNADGDCVDADGSAGECRTDEQVIPALAWSAYKIDLVGDAPVTCYRQIGVDILIDYSTRRRSFTLNRSETPCE
jgi:hypothetical protein